MTSKQFLKYLQEPDQMNDSSVVEMEQLIKQFPFFQTAHLLYLQALKRINPKLVKEKLPVESLYIADRSVLYGLLGTKEEAKTASVAAPKVEEKKTSDTQIADTIAAAAVKTPKPEKVEVKVETTEVKTEVKTETKAETPKAETSKEAEVKKHIVVEKPVAETKAATSEEKPAKQKLSDEQRKQNHDNLVKDFFDIMEEDNYQTVATNVADDGSIKSAAAEFASNENVNQAIVVNEKKTAPEKVEANTVETKAVTPEKTVETKTVETKTVTVETKTVETKDTNEKKDSILDKIASIRKEKEEAAKKKAEDAAKRMEEALSQKAEAEAEAAAAKAKAEEEAKKLAEEKAKAEAEAAAAKAKAEEEAKKLAEEKAKAEAEAAAAKAKAEAEAATVVTTTVVTETVTTTTTVEEKPAEAKAEKPMTAAEKLLANLNKYKKKEDKTEQNANSDTTDGTLIDKFLETDHHLDRNKEVEQGDMGQDSVKQPELYSEKLAKLYITQKLFDKALETYEQLSTKFPTKKEYFAQKIEEINKLKNNQ